MVGFCLVDLYVRSEVGRLETLSEAAKRAGLDAAVAVFDDPMEIPDERMWSALEAGQHGAPLLKGLAFNLQDCRFVLIGRSLDDSEFLGALEALNEAEAVIKLALERGCMALPVCPRQRPSGETRRDDILPLFPRPVGVVTEVIGANFLGRDLEVEDAAVSGRKALGATGPFATQDDVGRYATLLPVRHVSTESVIKAILEGRGVAVELSKTSSGIAKKRRRRRRSRGPRSRGQQRRNEHRNLED